MDLPLSRDRGESTHTGRQAFSRSLHGVPDLQLYNILFYLPVLHCHLNDSLEFRSLKRENPDLSEDVVLIRALRDSNLPKFLTDDALLFR